MTDRYVSKGVVIDVHPQRPDHGDRLVAPLYWDDDLEEVVLVTITEND